jgi:hypothetical protein
MAASRVNDWPLRSWNHLCHCGFSGLRAAFFVGGLG